MGVFFMRKNNKAVSISDYIDEFMCYCQSRKLSPKTLSSYEQTLRLFEKWVYDQYKIVNIQLIKETVINHYICDLQERGKYSFYCCDKQREINYPERRRDYRQPISICTINNYIRNLKVFFTWCESINAIKTNPMENVFQIKQDRKPREYLEDNEVSILISRFDKSYFAEHRDYVITMLLLDSGMRLGECLLLTEETLDLHDRVITIPAEITKGRKSRCVFFSMKTAKTIQKWLAYKDRYTDSKYLFPTKQTGLPVEVRSFESNFRKYIARAGIEKEVSPHALRNNFAKRCLLAGMDIYTLSRILGHSSVEVTEKAYLDLTSRDIRFCYEGHSPIENIR